MPVPVPVPVPVLVLVLVLVLVPLLPRLLREALEHQQQQVFVQMTAPVPVPVPQRSRTPLHLRALPPLLRQPARQHQPQPTAASKRSRRCLHRWALKMFDSRVTESRSQLAMVVLDQATRGRRRWRKLLCVCVEDCARVRVCHVWLFTLL